MNKPAWPRSFLAGILAGAVLLAASLFFAAPLSAQTLSNSFGGLSGSSDQPIDIESDVLVVQDKKKLATFKGNVKAVQGTTTLRAKELDVHYIGGDKLAPGAKKDDKGASPDKGANPEGAGSQGPSQAAPNGGAGNEDTKITKIEARGDVIINTEDDQTTTSDWALYDVPAQQVTVGGNVVLTQGKNVLKGDRLVIDLTTGESRFENTGDTAAGGRIRALFMPKQNAKDTKSTGAPAAEKKSGDAEAKTEDKPKDGSDETSSDDSDVPWPLDPTKQHY
jgi:lipopolysaccharide export system protein LptA